MAKKSKPIMYKFSFDFMSKESLSESDSNRLLGVLVQLIEKNKSLLGEDVLPSSYGIDKIEELSRGTWKRVNKNKAENEALRSEQEMIDYRDWLNNRHLEKSLPKEIEEYSVEKANYLHNDGEIIVEGTLGEVIDRLPNILQTDELWFSFYRPSADSDIKLVEVIDGSEPIGYVSVGLIEFGSIID
jgi:hypothetical protein